MSKKYKVNVNLAERSYGIFIQRNGLKSWPEQLTPLIQGKKCLIISDGNVYNILADKIVEMLSETGTFLYANVFPAGESSKNLARLDKVYHKVASAGLDRDAIIIALGGGVTGDIAGFVAATWMRGIDYVQIPTSLLAMVDSSVGGKTGIDLPEGKNLVGAFWQPKMVLIDPAFLKTLPRREILCGLAEIIKYGVIEDGRLFEQLERNIEQIEQLDIDFFTDIITRSCQIKAQIVEADEREAGIRAHLNYGHTFGHALEMVTGFSRLTHGEGVSIGMCMAADMALKMGLISIADAERQERLLKALGLLTHISNVETQAIVDAMFFDKKAKQSQLRFVLPEAIGKVSLHTVTDMTLVQEVVNGRII